jgi:hypothetical protein
LTPPPPTEEEIEAAERADEETALTNWNVVTDEAAERVNAEREAEVAAEKNAAN